MGIIVIAIDDNGFNSDTIIKMELYNCNNESLNHNLITFLDAKGSRWRSKAGFVIRAAACLAAGVTTVPSLLADRPTDTVQNLRLEGVTAINHQVTAYFTDTRTSHVFTLKIGEMGPGGYSLLRVEHLDDPGGGCAVLGRGNLLAKVTAGQGTEASSNGLVVPPPPNESNAAAEEEDSDERVAVRPWKDPNAR